MKHFVTVLAPVVLVLISAFGGFYFYQYRAQGKHPAPVYSPPPAAGEQELLGKARPAFALPDLAGQLRHVREWNGKVLVLNFWATWCPPCLKEIPEFIELQNKFGEDGLQFLGIALQQPGDVLEFVREHGMNYPVLAGETEVIPIAESYGNDRGALPYTAVIDRSGHIRFVHAGPVSGADLESIIRPLL